MRFVDSPNGERMKCLIYDILSKHGELRSLKIYAHIIISVADDDYEMQSQFNMQVTINEMVDVGLISRSPNFTYLVKPVEIEPLSPSTIDLSDCYCDGNFGGINPANTEIF